MALPDDTLALERLAHELDTTRYGRSVRHLASTDSTNDDARLDAAAGVPSGHIVVADAQLRGRGSRGRSWSSPPGTDLYVSIVDRVPVALAALPPLTLAVGLAVAEAADTLLAGTGAPPSQVKWPNDVQIGGRKCAGILIEANADTQGGEPVVIGIGLNINRTAFPQELRAQATSLRLADPAGRHFDRTHALARLLSSVERWVDRFAEQGPAAIVSALSPRLALLGRRARCGDALGIVRGIDASGALRLETARGIQQLIAGRLEPEESDER